MATKLADEDEMQEASGAIGDSEDVFAEEVELGGQVLIPEGRYTAVLSDLTPVNHKPNGDVQMICEYKITAPEKWRGYTRWDHIIYKRGNENGQYEKTRWKVDQTGTALKAPSNPDTGNWSFKPSILNERPVILVIEHQTFTTRDGVTKTDAKIKSVMPPDEEAEANGRAFYGEGGADD